MRAPALTVISSPVVTSLPLQYCHWMDGVPGTSTLQVSVYICPAVDMPESVMVTLNGSSRKERIHESAVKEVQLIEGPLIIHNVLAFSTLTNLGTRPTQAHSTVFFLKFPE